VEVAEEREMALRADEVKARHLLLVGLEKISGLLEGEKQLQTCIVPIVA
jgi:hypothetical protein